MAVSDYITVLYIKYYRLCIQPNLADGLRYV